MVDSLHLFSSLLSKGLGVVHVLTGPDHMSAVATLSANVRTRQAFWLGVRWGVGHSIGLLLVGIVLIAITVPANNNHDEQEGEGEGEVDGDEVVVPHTVEMVFESLVGVFMLLLGAYGIHRAVSRRRARADQTEKEQQLLEKEEDDSMVGGGDLEGADGDLAGLVDEGRNAPGGDMSPIEVGVATPPASAQVLLRGMSVGQEVEYQRPADNATRVNLEGEGSSLLIAGTPSAIEDAPDTTTPFQMEGASPPTGASIAREDGDVDPPPTDEVPARRCKISDRVSAGFAALLMGTVHGLAGPGGVLGVIPAVQLRDWKLAILYLGTFCVVSTLTMGTFATVFGTLSSKLVDRSAARLQFCMEFFPSCLSIVVGIVWLVLSPMGKLEEIFG
jgi:hypothetical protein